MKTARLASEPHPAWNPVMQDLVLRFSPEWEATSTSPFCFLLRLALLRDFSRAIHALRSELMSTQNDTLLKELEELEDFLNAKSGALSLEKLSLDQVRTSPLRVQRNELPFPEAFSDVVDLSKFDRSDRRWESTIAREAIGQGWSFWTLEASSDIHGVEALSREIHDRIWPRGIVLWVESEGFLRSDWRGKWTIVLEPDAASALSSDPALFQRANPKWTPLYPR